MVKNTAKEWEIEQNAKVTRPPKPALANSQRNPKPTKSELSGTCEKKTLKIFEPKEFKIENKNSWRKSKLSIIFQGSGNERISRLQMKSQNRIIWDLFFKKRWNGKRIVHPKMLLRWRGCRPGFRLNVVSSNPTLICFGSTLARLRTKMNYYFINDKLYNRFFLQQLLQK